MLFYSICSQRQNAMNCNNKSNNRSWTAAFAALGSSLILDLASCMSNYWAQILRLCSRGVITNQRLLNLTRWVLFWCCVYSVCFFKTDPLYSTAALGAWMMPSLRLCKNGGGFGKWDVGRRVRRKPLFFSCGSTEYYDTWHFVSQQEMRL